jgi:hypothetical protein
VENLGKMFYATLTIHLQELTDKKVIIDQISVTLRVVAFGLF